MEKDLKSNGETNRITDEREALAYIESSKDIVPLSMDEMRRLCDTSRGEMPFKVVHVAGTNGKGSTCAFIASILNEAGYKTGLFTSPHLINYHERIAVGGKAIPGKELAECANRVKSRAEALGLTPPPFAKMTAIAVEYFKRKKVKAAVFEVGLGGRLDPTNMLEPDITVITAIGIDHTDKLGSTVPAIAREKGGIIKRGRAVVCHPQVRGAEEVLREICEEREATYIDTSEYEVEVALSGLTCQEFTLGTDKGYLSGLTIPLAGRHQMDNVRSAVITITQLRETGMKISDEDIRKGLAKTKWPCRMEYHDGHTPILLDGAHNEQAAEALEKAVTELLPGKNIILIAGIMRDKDADGIARHMGFAHMAFTVQPDPQRGMDAWDFADYLKLYTGRVTPCESAEEALRQARKTAREHEGVIVIAGSLYLCGAIKRVL
jgi:dihydrofolate synthase / folylpolyglutamate synthase